MKKLIIILFILLARADLYAQDLVNGNFSSNSEAGSYSSPYNNSYWPNSIVGLRLQTLDYPSPDVTNWIETFGTPCFAFPGSGPDAPFMHLQTAGWQLHGCPPSYTVDQVGPGSVGIAANYPFIKGGCYTITINFLNASADCNGMVLKLFAASGLTQLPWEPPAVSSTPPPSFTGQPIPGHDFVASETVTGPLSFTFTATDNYDQLLIYVDDPSPCTVPVLITTLCGTHFSISANGSLTANIKSVSITPCQCSPEILNVNKSTQISTGSVPGGVFEFSTINTGSSSALGGDPIVTTPPDHSTVFWARDIKLEPNFLAVEDNGSFFEATPTMSCADISCGPIQISDEEGNSDSVFCPIAGETFPLYPHDPGCTWSSSNPSIAAIDPTTGIVTESGHRGRVTFTYTIGDCTLTQEIIFVCLHRHSTRSTDTNSVSSIIEVYPNPTQDNVTITYPCQSAGQLEITIQDVDSRTIYSQSIGCTDGGGVQQIVDMSTFTPGVYFVNLTLNEQHVVKKVVKL